MRAIDTNVLVRFLVRDDESQARRAFNLVAAGDLFVPTTVVLETEWVIRRLYGYSPKATAAALRQFLGAPGLSLEAPELVAQALDGLERGLDFADALHLASARHCESFFTFDRKLARMALVWTIVSVEEP